MIIITKKSCRLIFLEILNFYINIKEILFRFKKINTKSLNFKLKSNYEAKFTQQIFVNNLKRNNRRKNTRFGTSLIPISYIVIKEELKKIKVLDWGGGYGIQGLEIISLFGQQIDFTWDIIELKKIVNKFKNTIKKINFLEFHSGKFYDLTYFNGSVSYLEIEKVFNIVGHKSKYIFLSRVVLTKEETFLTYDKISKNHEYIYNYDYFFKELQKYFEIVEIFNDEKLSPARNLLIGSQNAISIFAKKK
jgi:putative methyltransferase (TIGR04325 family)